MIIEGAVIVAVIGILDAAAISADQPTCALSAHLTSPFLRDSTDTILADVTAGAVTQGLTGHGLGRGVDTLVAFLITDLAVGALAGFEAGRGADGHAGGVFATALVTGALGIILTFGVGIVGAAALRADTAETTGGVIGAFGRWGSLAATIDAELVFVTVITATAVDPAGRGYILFAIIAFG